MSTTNETIVRYLPLAHATASAIHRKLPRSVDVDDLKQDAALGLRDAVLGYDPAQGVPFARYAARRISGAVYDGLRNRDWTPRGARSRGRVTKLFPFSALEQNGLNGEQRNRLDAGQLNMEGCAAAIVHSDFDAIDAKDEVEWATRGMSRSCKLAVRLYYGTNLTLKQIGRAVGVSECFTHSILHQARTLIHERYQSAHHPRAVGNLSISRHATGRRSALRQAQCQAVAA